MSHAFSAEEERLIAIWERHMSCEFAQRDAAASVATMSDENYVNHVPTMTGGRGREEMLAASASTGTRRRSSSRWGCSPRPTSRSRAPRSPGRSSIPACPPTS